MIDVQRSHSAQQRREQESCMHMSEPAAAGAVTAMQKRQGSISALNFLLQSQRHAAAWIEEHPPAICDLVSSFISSSTCWGCTPAPCRFSGRFPRALDSAVDMDPGRLGMLCRDLSPASSFVTSFAAVSLSHLRHPPKSKLAKQRQHVAVLRD